jgi:hypothetical protein
LRAVFITEGGRVFDVEEDSTPRHLFSLQPAEGALVALVALNEGVHLFYARETIGLAHLQLAGQKASLP